MSSTKTTFLIFLCSVFIARAQSNSLVEGYISDPAGNPMVGVSVVAAGHAHLGTATDSSGYFKFLRSESIDSLRITFTGYRSKVVSVLRESPMSIELQPAVFQLEEVFVTGFGQQKARAVTGAISKAGPKAFERMPINSWQLGLQGQLPGVQITPASGGQAAANSIRIRGVNSISAGNQPLIVIDGIVMPAQNGSWTLGFQTNPLQTLNPEDIASVEVLKDAASAAIYGAQAGNGVLLITTKKGKAQPSRLRAGYYAGFAEISNRYDLLSGQEYAALWNEAAVNAGLPDFRYDVAAQPDTDWQSLILQRGLQHQAHASLSGGSEQTQYYISTNYKDEEGYLITTRLRRFNLRANIQHQFNDRWSVGLNLAPSRLDQQYTGHQYLGSPHAWSAWFFPNVEAFDEQGEYIKSPIFTSLGFGGINGNPLVVLKEQEVRLQTQQFLGSGYVEVEFRPNLSLRSTLAGEQTHESEQGYNSPATFFGRFGGLASQLNQQLNTLQWSNQVNWQPTLPAQHRLKAIAGMQYLESGFTVNSASGAPVDERIRTLASTTQVSSYFSERQTSAFLGYFAQFQYSFRDRWLATLSARYDGSSRFGRSNQFGYFPALGLGWIMVDRPLNYSGGLNYLKMRGSLGVTGNAAIDGFPARGRVNNQAGYLGQPGFSIFDLENQQLGWEENTQFNLGFDLAFWQNRLSGSIDFFNRNTRDLLFQAPIPATNGASSVWLNAGQLRNTGAELQVNARVLQSHLSWDISLNGAWLRNQVVDLPDTDGDGRSNELVLNDFNLFRPGEAAGAFYLIPYAGVDPENGDALFYRADGTTTNQAALAERQIAGSPIPDFSGGMQHQLSLGPFGLTAFFHFKAGHQAYLMHQSDLENNMANGFNQLRSQLNAWTPENPDTDVPQARLYQSNGNQMSTRYLHDADYLRLQNLTLSYEWRPKKQPGALIKLFASAQNLWTWTRFPGLDPNSEFFDIQSGAQGGMLYNLPAPRTFIFGFETQLQ